MVRTVLATAAEITALVAFLSMVGLWALILGSAA
jgi:hypothetical protein